MRARVSSWLVAYVLATGLVLPALAVAETTPASQAATASADPSGRATGGAVDIPAAKPGEPTPSESVNAVGHNKVSINVVWTLIAGFLVMFMQCGFAMVETGFCRIKNAANTMCMNFLIYPLALLGFYAVGFAFMFGGIGPLATFGGYGGLDHEITIHLFGKTFGLLGGKGFFLSWSSYDVSVFTLFLFQGVFMDTAATIPTGACAERWKFSAFFLYALLVGAVIYPIYGNWVWGGGWLSQLGTNFGLGHGHVDFAGSSVVHLTGGVIAFVGAWFLGPRLGKYKPDGTPNVLPSHSIPMAINGTLILAFGWFGFNAGSTLSGTDLRIGVIAVNTMLSSSVGAVSACVWAWKIRMGKPDPGMMANGMLAGLVAITAPCAFVSSPTAVLIGAVAGVLVVEAMLLLERKLRIDDPVGAVSVHGVNGIWGIIALGLFADGTYGEGWNGVPGAVRGLFYGDASQLAAGLVGIVANVVYVGLATLAVFNLIEVMVGNRVSKETEIRGLDVPEMGVEAYPWFDASLHAADAEGEPNPPAPTKDEAGRAG